MLDKNKKAMNLSSDGDTDFFEDTPGVLQADTLAPLQLIICLNDNLQTAVDLIKQKCYALKNKMQTVSRKNY